MVLFWFMMFLSLSFFMSFFMGLIMRFDLVRLVVIWLMFLIAFILFRKFVSNYWILFLVWRALFLIRGFIFLVHQLLLLIHWRFCYLLIFLWIRLRCWFWLFWLILSVAHLMDKVCIVSFAHVRLLLKVFSSGRVWAHFLILALFRIQNKLLPIHWKQHVEAIFQVLPLFPAVLVLVELHLNETSIRNIVRIVVFRV
jgi:hypothetical protein